MAEDVNIHGCAIVLGRTGVLIRGPSGSGKSRAARLLVEEFGHQKKFARWVADDRLKLCSFPNAIIVEVPNSIAGLAEHRFANIENVAFENKACLDLVVDLVLRNELERLPEDETVALMDGGPELPLIKVPADDTEQAVEIILSQIRGMRANFGI